MAKLIINPQMPSRKEIDLPKAGLSIGRDPTNDIVIPDALVSRRHARIVYDGKEYLFHDCESSNGSLLNGDRVSERKLSDGDVLWLGASRLLFRAPETETEGSLAKVIQHPSSQRLRCQICDHTFQGGDVFCRNCGATLASEVAGARCGSCHSRVMGRARFCNSCGASMMSRAEMGPPRLQPIERRKQVATPLPIGASLITASLEKRLLAALVDSLAAGALFALLSVLPLIAYLRLESGALAAALFVLPLSSVPAYFAGFWAARAATPGKELLGLHIVMKDGVTPFGPRQAAVRFAGFCVSLATLGLGFLMVLIDGDTLHDGLAGTRVVERRS